MGCLQMSGVEFSDQHAAKQYAERIGIEYTFGCEKVRNALNKATASCAGERSESMPFAGRLVRGCATRHGRRRAHFSRKL
jgi:hypothetical protein